MNKSISEIRQEFYDQYYSRLAPSHESINLAKDLWSRWITFGAIPPDIDDIAYNTLKFENDYFQEIVSFACSKTKSPIRIEQAPFILNSYNLCAISATDGYLVIVDETFFKMLFSLTNILIFSAHNFIEDQEEHVFKAFFKQLIYNHLEKKDFYPFHRQDEPEILSLLSRDYNTAELAVYLFNSFKTFMLAHEIGHCFLAHADNTTKQSFFLQRTKCNN